MTLFKYNIERNWANMVTCLRIKYDLPLNDTNIAKLSKSQWKCMVKKQIKRVAFNYLSSSCSNDKKTSYLSYEKLERQEYITVIEPQYARTIFKARNLSNQSKLSTVPQMYKRNLLFSFCEKVDENVPSYIQLW